MQVDQGLGPTKTYFWEGLTTRAKYGMNMVCAVDNPGTADFCRSAAELNCASVYFCSTWGCGGSVEGALVSLCLDIRACQKSGQIYSSIVRLTRSLSYTA